MSFLFVSESALQTVRVTIGSGLPGMRSFQGCGTSSASTVTSGETRMPVSADHSGTLLTRSVPALCHERPEHLLVSRFP